MSSEQSGSTCARRNPNTQHIDQLSTLDMLKVINSEDRQIAEAVRACLPEVARVVDNATDVVGRGGRLVLIGAGASGRAAMQAVCEFAPDGEHALRGVIAGGVKAMLQEVNDAAGDYEQGIRDLQAIAFSQNDMLLALSVSGKTPWVWGGLRHAWSLGARSVLITQNSASEAAQLADIVLMPVCGPEVIAGFGNPKAQLAQKQILNMLTHGLAIRCGRIWSNLRIDLPFDSIHWSERQIAVVMAATQCSRTVAKTALEASHHHCPVAILMTLTGLDASEARGLLTDNCDHLRLALQQAQGRVSGSHVQS
jgi:N-acetylmuramic acid 6-phosphate etherase